MSFTSNLCCSRCPDTGVNTTPVFYQTKPQFSSYPIGAYCLLPVWKFCSQLNQSLRHISLPSYPSISSRFPLHCSAAPSDSSCHMEDLLRSFFSLWPITRVISSHSAPPLAGHHSAPPPGGTPSTSRQAEWYKRWHRGN